MKKKKLLSWMLSLVMALTVFSIPVGAVYAEGEDGDYSLPSDFTLGYDKSDGDRVMISGSEIDLSEIESDLFVYCKYEGDDYWSDFNYDDYTFVWKSENPEIAKLTYWNNDDDQFIIPAVNAGVQEFQWNASVGIKPQKEGTANLKLTVSKDGTALKTISLAIVVQQEDLTKFCIAVSKWDKVTEETQYNYLENNSTINFSTLGEQKSLCVCSDEYKDEESTWRWCISEEHKMVWHNQSASVATAKYYDEGTDEWVNSNSEEFECDEFYVVPASAGAATFTADIYGDSTDDAVIVATLAVTINITEADVDKAKYKPYLDWNEIVWFADVDDQEMCGGLPDINEYNEAWANEYPRLTSEDYSKLRITAAVAGKTINVKLGTGDSKYEFRTAIGKVACGSWITLTYKMGTYAKTEKVIVSKYVEPKITVKNYVYDGKVHKTTATVKVGNTTLKNGRDYEFYSGSMKNVGAGYYEIYNASDRTNKYRFYKEGHFNVNPKGTSLGKLKGAKKAITVKWKKQATKMSTSTITGYQIQLATNKAFTKNKKLVTVKGFKTVSKKVKKLKKKKKYFVRIRTYKTVGKTNFYSGWSKVKTIKTK